MVALPLDDPSKRRVNKWGKNKWGSNKWAPARATRAVLRSGGVLWDCSGFQNDSIIRQGNTGRTLAVRGPRARSARD